MGHDGDAIIQDMKAEQTETSEWPVRFKRLREEHLPAITAAFACYPDSDEYPYHNKRHGVDVMKAADWLFDQVPAGLFAEREQGLLLLAAAWHDAGYGDSAAEYPKGIGKKEKERYAVHLFREYAERAMPELTDDNKDFIERAIMGTLVGPEADRTTPEAALLHMADIGFLFDESLAAGSEPSQQVRMPIQRWRQERVPHLSPSEFIKLEEKFLAAEAVEIQQLAMQLGLGRELADEYGARVLGAMRAVRQVAEGESYGD